MRAARTPDATNKSTSDCTDATSLATDPNNDSRVTPAQPEFGLVLAQNHDDGIAFPSATIIRLQAAGNRYALTRQANRVNELTGR
jgi:hypothetical protein